jgi:UrcA family protein
MSVAYGDLNLADPAARVVLQTRLQSAAASVCGPVDYSLDTRGSEVVAAQSANSRCLRHAVQDALVQIEARARVANASGLTAVGEREAPAAP